MLNGFKDFVTRGNVVELAVAVVVGTAFAAVVDTMVTSIITPLLNAAGGAEVGRLGFEIIRGNEATYLDLAAILNALVVFVVTAAVVYFLVVAPMNTVIARRREAAGVDSQPPEVPENVALLREIRDLLARADGLPR